MSGATTAAQARQQGISLAEWRVIILSSLGGALEFYDFVIYAMFASVIGRLFFPTDDPVLSLFIAFVVFSTGYLARPIGGVVLGWFGDKFGRRRVFIVSILMMSAATLGMGLLPTFNQIGVVAAVLMVLLRLVQGFSLGGELPGAITYVVETAPRKAGFASGVIFFCVNTGVALATLLALGVNTFLDAEQVLSFGWRLGFLVGGVLGLISFWLRLSLEETKEFMRQDPEKISKHPTADILRTRPAALLVGIAAIACTGGFNGYLFTMPAFMETVNGYTRESGLFAQLAGLSVLSVGLIIFAWIGDRVPRRLILGVGAILLAGLAYPFFVSAATPPDERVIPLWLLFVFAGLVASLFNGVFSGMIADIFPTRIRFSGIGISMNIAFTIFSGVAPMAATGMVLATGDKTSAAYFMYICGAIGLMAAVALTWFDGQIRAGLPEHANDPASQRVRAPWERIKDGGVFDLLGRATRLQFLLTLIATSIIGAVIAYVSLWIVGSVQGVRGIDPALIWLLVGFVALPPVLAFLAASSRRLHDIGQSGWLSLLYFFLPVALVLQARGAEGAMMALYVLPLAAVLLLAAQLLLPGQAGANKFGAPGSARVAKPAPAE